MCARFAQFFRQRIEKRVEYLNSYDTTIMGSRNGQSPLFMWLTIRKKGIEARSVLLLHGRFYSTPLQGFRADAKRSIEMSQYLYNKFKKANLKVAHFLLFVSFCFLSHRSSR